MLGYLWGIAACYLELLGFPGRWHEQHFLKGPRYRTKGWARVLPTWALFGAVRADGKLLPAEALVASMPCWW